MGLWLRWGGALAVIVGSFFVCREYEKYLARRLGELIGLRDLISHARGMIEKYLSYGAELWRGFTNEALESCGLMDALREGRGLSEAFASCGDRMALTAEERAELACDFARLGKGYKSGEVSLLDTLENKLCEMADGESDQAEKNIKVFRALLLGGALVVVITVV